MIEFEELKQKLAAIQPQIADLKNAIGYDHLKSQLEEYEQRTAEPNFWDDLERSQKILKEQRECQNKVDSYDKLCSLYDDLSTLVELALEEDDASVLEEAQTEYEHLSADVEAMTLSTLLTGEYDANNALLTFHAGAGGTEAQDWAQMLYRMYTRWAERHGFTIKVLDYLDGDEAGLKSASIMVEGTNAYGFLKGESGVHRLVRVSPFDSSGRRHTSFASLEVTPEIVDSMEVEIRDEDLRVDTYRSSGAGGQHINKTESAIRITHLPTGIVVACQNERSQHQNREVAMNMLRSKLVELKERAHLDKIEDLKGDQKEIAWGAQIRSYVFMPYTMVKDHRTDCETSNVAAVMDGDLDLFINEYLKALSLGKIQR